MIVLLREFLSGFAEHGTAGTVLSEEASRRVGILDQLARDTGPAFAPPLDRRRLRVRLLPARRRQRGIVRRGGLPYLASNSAMRAFNAFTCASNSSMRSSRAAICAMSLSIRASSDATSWAPSLLSESISVRGMTSVNQLAGVGSIPQARVTMPQRGE